MNVIALPALLDGFDVTTPNTGLEFRAALAPRFISNFDVLVFGEIRYPGNDLIQHRVRHQRDETEAFPFFKVYGAGTREPPIHSKSERQPIRFHEPLKRNDTIFHRIRCTARNQRPPWRRAKKIAGMKRNSAVTEELIRLSGQA